VYQKGSLFPENALFRLFPGLSTQGRLNLPVFALFPVSVFGQKARRASLKKRGLPKKEQKRAFSRIFCSKVLESTLKTGYF